MFPKKYAKIPSSFKARNNSVNLQKRYEILYSSGNFVLQKFLPTNVSSKKTSKKVEHLFGHHPTECSYHVVFALYVQSEFSLEEPELSSDETYFSVVNYTEEFQKIGETKDLLSVIPKLVVMMFYNLSELTIANKEILKMAELLDSSRNIDAADIFYTRVRNEAVDFW